MMPEDVIELSKKELVEKLSELNFREEDIKAEMVMIRTELLHRLTEEKKDGELIGEYSITRAKRTTFVTTIAEAEPLGAVKQAVDTEALRKLVSKGITVPGKVVTEYLSVRRISQEEGLV